ncbi:class II SORL domain-containing protein [Miniphocaeibacter massiliensis]|uniref:class II SORL domain-containing protein n=1 Tax=Miniphocaeibacter massiliensis TaxID=2041841 RepID=UPI000C1BE5D1|nr:class II SORL domain-containing protein [Miniphocaeibacter massiliensis]
MSIGNLYQTADWKGEKHVPAIDAPTTVKAGEEFEVAVQVGKEIEHPNTFEHHIVWVKLYYLPKDAKLPVEIGNYDFSAHGEAEALTSPKVVTKLKLNKCGKLISTSYCNIHGLWTSEVDITIEA